MPRAAAVAGVAFALLFGAALLLVRLSIPGSIVERGGWLADPAGNLRLATDLLAWGGIAFLWFIGVVRDRIGAAEDRLFATVFLGTGLLFVAMLFVAAAVNGALLEVAQRQEPKVSEDVWSFGRHAGFQVLTVYAMRMAGMFTIVTTTIAIRLGIFPRWLAAFGFIVAVVLLLTVESTEWAVMLFPLWVLVLSVHFLVGPPADRLQEV